MCRVCLMPNLCLSWALPGHITITNIAHSPQVQVYLQVQFKISKISVFLGFLNIQYLILNEWNITPIILV